ncbi:MAG: hypothetical protein OHK0019_15030 [Saprospiraceae bacterium]
MKNYILPALILALAFSQTFAQKTFSPGAKPHIQNLPANVKRLFHRAGFDLQAQPADKVASRSQLQLDSTKTYYGYNIPAPGDSTPLFRSNYTYPSANEKVEVNFAFENGAWAPQNRSTLQSDDQERLVSVLAEGYDPETQEYKLDSRIQVFPHGDSPDLIDSAFTYLWDSTILDWHIILSIRNTFDAQDRLQESLSSIDYFGDPLVFKEIYSYDANGDNHLIEEFAVLGDDVFPSSRTDITYTDHHPIEVTVSLYNGLDFFPSSRVNYAYTLFGAVRLVLSFEWENAINNWKMTERIEYKFDGQQRVSSKETTIDPTSTAERELVHYGYIQDDNLSIEMSFNWDDDLFDWILDNKKHYYYNGLVSTPFVPNPALSLQIIPNPTVDAIRLTLDNEAFVQIFSTSGTLVQSQVVQPGQMLNLVDLPVGVYQVTAKQGADFYSGKIVKQ